MMKIAIIEDDAAIAQMYRMKFEAEGYEVNTATTGRHGLELARDFKPDIMLSDIMMPDMPGDEMLKSLRAQPWGKNIKVIILSNRSEQEIAAATSGLNVSAIIVKANMPPRQVFELVKQKLDETGAN
ncbi:MAG: response regulator transcription factor [Candidatus Saccharimonadales bacterium]